MAVKNYIGKEKNNLESVSDSSTFTHLILVSNDDGSPFYMYGIGFLLPSAVSEYRAFERAHPQFIY